jgi:hypothetical protein
MRALILVGLAALSVSAMGASEPLVQVEYSNPGLVPAHWTIEVHPDGSAHIRSERGSAARSEGQGIEAPDLDRDFQLSTSFTEHVFQVAHRKKLFGLPCESHMKVAFQGTKKFTYSGPDGQGMCEFNYSKDAEIESLGDDLVSVANTLMEGARLQSLLLHDRLGLDQETEILAESAADGRAQQIGSIRDILEQLANDDSVLERVRRRARALLDHARK